MTSFGARLYAVVISSIKVNHSCQSWSYPPVLQHQIINLNHTWPMSHLLTWKGQGLWPVLLAVSRGWAYVFASHGQRLQCVCLQYIYVCVYIHNAAFLVECVVQCNRMYWIILLCHKSKTCSTGKVNYSSVYNAFHLTFLPAFFFWVKARVNMWCTKSSVCVGVWVCVHVCVCCACLKNTGRQIGKWDRKR